MMRWIVGGSLQFRLLVVAASAVLIFFGFTDLRNMPVDVVPEFSRTLVEIQTEALGLSAAEVEAMITVPLEADMLNGVSWVEEIRSESMPGVGTNTPKRYTTNIKSVKITRQRSSGILIASCTPPITIRLSSFCRNL